MAVAAFKLDIIECLEIAEKFIRFNWVTKYTVGTHFKVEGISYDITETRLEEIIFTTIIQSDQFSDFRTFVLNKASMEQNDESAH